MEPIEFAGDNDVAMKCETLAALRPPARAELKEVPPPAAGPEPDTPERHFRRVLRPQMMGRATCVKLSGMLFA